MSNPFADAARDAVATATGVSATDLKVEAPPRPELGDFAVGCFPAAKQLGKAPAAIAAEVATAFTPTPYLAAAAAAGPFVNFRADRAAAFRWVIDHALAGKLVPHDGAGKTICIDYSSPNISKELAYHHIRSTSIGHSLAEIYRALGYRVVGINHLGDWGNTHGMLIAACKRWGEVPDTVEGLNQLYVKFKNAAKDDPTLDVEARAWFKRLEDGDAEARAMWQRFRDISWQAFDEVYDMLGLHFDEVRGESAYEADMPRVIAELQQKGLVTESEGSLVVVLEGEKIPLRLTTKEGTTLYATRDIAAAQYRWEQYRFERSLYVVDRGQALHFRQLFKALLLAGHEWATRCLHVPFGLIRLGGKKTGTRTGNVVLLRSVLEEAIAEVRPKIVAVNPAMDAAAVDATARMVGVGAVVFANLITQRDKDIDFTMEKATELDGDTGPYVQYSHARCASIQRKADGAVTPELAAGAPVELLTHDLEWAIARRLLGFAEHVKRAGDGAEPHHIAHYLLDLSADFARWFTAGNTDRSLRVLTDDAAARSARLALVAAVQSTLRQGLGLLGIGAPDVM